MILSEKHLQISQSPTLTIDAKYKHMISEGTDVIGFGAGEPDFDTPEHIKSAAVDAIKNGFTKYTPAAGTPELKKAICEKLKKDNGLSYSTDQIVVSNGAKHSLVNALCAVLNPGDEVIIPAPFWVSYPEIVKLADGIPVPVYADGASGFKLSKKQIVSAITPKTKAFILNSPNNPTGMVADFEELSMIAELAAEYNFFVISDEIYEKFIYDGKKHISIASLNDKIKKLTIVVNGFSKSYSMTGWRLGYTASEPEIASVMSNVQSHATSNPCSISQAAGLAALLGSQDDVDTMRKTFCERRNYMVHRINSTGLLSCLNPDGAFYLMVDVSEIIGREYNGRIIENCDVFCELLLEYAQVALVPGTGFGAPSCVRLSYAVSSDRIKKGLDRLDEFLGGVKQYEQ